MVLVAKKIKLKNTKILHKILKPWYEAYKYTYNRTLFYMKETQIYDKTSLNKIILSKEACCRSTWILNTPQKIRDSALREAIKNFKSAMTNYKNGNIKYFDLKFLSSKKRTWCINNICKEGIKRISDNSLRLFPTFTDKYIFTLKGKIPKQINHEPNIYFNGLNYYMIFIIDKEIQNDQNRRKVIAIDPGSRKLMTCYNMSETPYSLGIRSYRKILYLQNWIDKYKSEKETLFKYKTLEEWVYDYINHKTHKKYLTSYKRRKILDKRILKTRIKIQNKIKNIHHYISGFLCKRYKNILLPKLDIKRMLRKDSLPKYVRKTIIALKISELNELMKTKAILYNTNIFEANERYSSRLCSKCRFINKSDILETKICKNCGSTLDRDINAAKNIYHMNIHLLDD